MSDSWLVDLFDTYGLEESIDILAGDSASGKTTLLFQMTSAAIAAGRLRREEVLHLALDRREKDYHKIFERLDTPKAHRFKVVSVFDWFEAKHPVKDHNNLQEMRNLEFEVNKWLAEENVMLHWVMEQCCRAGARRVHLDTAQKVAPTTRLNDQRAVAFALQKMMHLMIRRSVLCPWHINKTAPLNRTSIFDAISGSAALKGFTNVKGVIARPCDVVLKGDRALPAPGLHLIGNALPHTFVPMFMERGIWRYGGQPYVLEEMAPPALRPETVPLAERVVAALHERQPQSIGELAEILEADRGSVRNALADLFGDGRVRKDGPGRKAKWMLHAPA